MRLLIILLLVLITALQYRLWFGPHSIKEYVKRQDEISLHQATNQELEKRNRLLMADVADLQSGLDSIEERARNELGLVKQDEIFFRLVAPKGRQ